MADKKPRPIRLDQFKKQLEEVGIGDLQEVQLDANTSIFIRLATGINADDTSDFQARIQACSESREMATIALGWHDGSKVLTEFSDEAAQRQWDLYEAAGGTADEFAILWAAAQQDMQERLGKLRPRRS